MIVTPAPEDEPNIYTDIPSLLAKAWDEGIEAGVDGSVPPCDYARNPYRTTK